VLVTHWGLALMLLHEDLLAIARRNVARARQLVESQRAVVHRREIAGLGTELSEEVLRMFERSLAKFEDDLARLTPTKTASNAGSAEPHTEPEGQTALEHG
jgi:hypothetical protein